MEITKLYRELDRDLARLYSCVQGWNNETRTPFVADDAAMAELDGQWKSLQDRAEALEVPDGACALVQHHFRDFLSTLAFLMDSVRKHPEESILGYHYLIPKIAWLDDSGDEIRCRRLVDSYEAVLREEKAYVELICGKHAGHLRPMISDVKGAAEALRLETGRLEEHFPGFTEEQKARVQEASEEYSRFLDRLAEAMEIRSADEPAAGEPEVVDDLSRRVKMDPEVYRTLLRDQHGVDLDELLAWHREEMEKTRKDCFRIAAELGLPDTDPTTMEGVNDILFRYEPPCATGEEMHARCNEYLKRTRALAHQVLRLPEEEQAVCLPIPKIYAAAYPWGGYEGGDFRQKPYIGRMFLNQYNTENISDGWIKLNALHESYPGHHCQAVRNAMDPLPATVKIGSRLIPLLEGTCLRTESVYGGLFEEDPVFRLFTAYRRHHASVRIYVDLMLFYYGNTIGEAVEVYEKELAFDRKTARAQVYAHECGPGYFTCYYYGMKKLTQWERELGWDETEYTELLFSAGYISMESFRMLLDLTEEERQRYFTEFGPGEV